MTAGIKKYKSIITIISQKKKKKHDKSVVSKIIPETSLISKA